MPKIIEETIEYSNLEKDILPILKNKIFHVSNGDGTYHQICRDGFIGHNKKERYKNTFPQSKRNWGALNEAVCLVDLFHDYSNYYKNDIDLVSHGYYFPNPNQNKKVAFYILKEEYYSHLVFQNDIRENGIIYGTYVPLIECWHKGDLSLDKIDEILLINVVNFPEEDPRFGIRLTDLLIIG